jgi:hypothetical protein
MAPAFAANCQALRGEFMNMMQEEGQSALDIAVSGAAPARLPLMC